MEKIKEQLQQIKEQIATMVIGQEEVVDGLLLAIMVGGHILLEGPPGAAKTLLAKTMAASLAAGYQRIQFTPDLMPLDVIGTHIFDFQKQQFSFHPGPIFTDILLADEINRTPPKTQAALLEAMEEKQVTVDGKRHTLSPVFTVIATQNPLEYEGTYPLPEAQLDRFLLKLVVPYPAGSSEIAIYRKYQTGTVTDEELKKIRPVLASAEILQIRDCVGKVTVREELFDYLYQLVFATRNHPLLSLGASPRAGLHLLLAAKASAVLQGRDYLVPDDLQKVIFPVLRHRLAVKPEAQIDGKTSDRIIEYILEEVKVPR